MGLSEDTISALSFQLWGFFSSKGLEAQRMAEIGLDPNDRRLNQTMQLVYEIDGFPQHLSMTCGGARGWPLPLFAQGLEGEAIDEPAAKMWSRITSPCG